MTVFYMDDSLGDLESEMRREIFAINPTLKYQSPKIKLILEVL